MTLDQLRHRSVATVIAVTTPMNKPKTWMPLQVPSSTSANLLPTNASQSTEHADEQQTVTPPTDIDSSKEKGENRY